MRFDYVAHELEIENKQYSDTLLIEISNVMDIRRTIIAMPLMALMKILGA